MNLGVASYITSAGLKAVTSGGSLGPYFALKYFVPFYDYRIDKTICRGISGTTSALSISSLNLVSATHSTLFGEKLFADADYQLSNSDFLYWTSNMGVLIEGATNNNVLSQQSFSTDVNLLYGKPLSNTVSGNTVSATATGLFTVTNTNVLSGLELSQYDPTSAALWPSSAFHRVASYSPNVNGITSATGSYKCRILPSSIGSYKFNGIAIYAVKVDGNGFDDSGNGLNVFNYNPTLFSVILFDQAQYKQAGVGGINDFEISVDLGFDWNTVNPGISATPMYVNSNYWIKLPTASSTSAYALNYDGDVVISTSSVPGSWTPRAKLTVTEKGRQQLRLANDDTRFTDFRTIRFPIDGVSTTATNYNDRAVLAIDTSCPDDSLLQMGYATTALGIKSIAMGCYASATGYYNGGFIAEDFGDNSEVTVDDIRNDSGGYTVSIGVKSVAQGFGSWATGFNTSSIGYLNFAGGDSSIASYFEYNDSQFNPDRSMKNGLNFSFGKLTSAISRKNDLTTSEGCLYNNNSYGSEADDESFGSNIAFGVRTLSNGGLSFAHGNLTSALGMASWATGYKNLASGCFAYVNGSESIAKYLNSWAMGYKVSAIATFGYVFGKDSVAGNDNEETYFSMAIGDHVSATNMHSIGIGNNVLSTGVNSIAIGQRNQLGDKLTVANEINSISIGVCTSATGVESIAIGQNSLAEAQNSISIGSGNWVRGKYSTGLGTDVYTFYDWSLATNYKTSAHGIASLSTGRSTYAGGDYSFVGGLNSYVDDNAQCAFAFGYKTSALGANSIALGPLANAEFMNSIAIGADSKTTKENQIVIGSCNSEIVLKGSVINIGGDDCSSVVTIPGLQQLNDSVGVEIYTDGSLTQTIKFYRAGYGTSEIVIQPLSEFQSQWSVTSIKNYGVEFKCQMRDAYGNGYPTIFDLSVGNVMDMRVFESDTNLWKLCFDSEANQVIFYVGSYYTDSSLTPITYSTSPILNDVMRETQKFYSNDSKCKFRVEGAGNFGYSHHHLFYRKNFNSIVGRFFGYSGSSGQVTNNRVYFYPNDYKYDGFCAVNIEAQSPVGPYSACTITERKFNIKTDGIGGQRLYFYGSILNCADWTHYIGLNKSA